MSENENDGFDDIVNGSEDETEELEFNTIMELVAHYWPKYNPGHIFVKGMVVLESVAPEGRGNAMESSSPITDSEILGFCEWTKAKIIADINADAWREAMIGMEDDDDDEDIEDEQ